MKGNRYQTNATSFGLGMTSLTAVAFLVGLLEPLEKLALHVRQVTCNNREVDSRIAHVDYDDGTLALATTANATQRDYIAGLIRALHDLGARAVAMDILFGEPQRLKVDDPVMS